MFDRLFRAAPALLLSGISLATGCATEPPPPEKAPPTLNLETMRQLARVRQQYVDALLLCGSASLRDWEQAKRQLELLPPGYRIFDEDPDLIKRFRAGDEKARTELGRRGRILNDLAVFSKGYDKSAWEKAQKELMEEGLPAQILLATVLVEILINGEFAEDWDHVRTVLVEIGTVGFETIEGWARALIESTPADAPIFRIEPLTQSIVAIIWFGEKGRPLIEEFSRSPKPNVRRGCARAIGEAMHAPSAPILVRLLSQDPEWIVRTMAATALGKMAGAKAPAGQALVDALKKEKERLAVRAILESLGMLKYEDAVPELIKALDHPHIEIANQAMQSLYHITGQRLAKKEQWLQWYATDYPRWKARPRPPQ